MSTIQFARIMLLFASRVMSNHLLHTIDANFNHASVRLCALGDTTRLNPNNYTVNSPPKTIHHNLTEDIKSLALELIYPTDSRHDVTENLENQVRQSVRKAYRDFISFITSNGKSIEQSLLLVDKQSELTDINIRISLLNIEQMRFLHKYMIWKNTITINAE